ncbi:MAG: hypothetical protein QM765_35880 [Myxococcales bacterium]
MTGGAGLLLLFGAALVAVIVFVVRRGAVATSVAEAESEEPAEPEPLSQELPVRRDATLNLAVQVRDTGAQAISTAASALEAPSMIAAVRRFLPDFRVSFPVAAQGDPRLPIRPVEHLLWTYEQSGALIQEAAPNLPPPPEQVAREVGLVAQEPYRLDGWSNAAHAAAHVLMPEDLRQVLAVMVHPPKEPELFEPWDWYFRVQVAAALVVSHLGVEPWSESARRRALEDVLDGPADWSNTAAAIALLDVAQRDEAARPQVVEALLRTTRRSVNPPAYQHAIRPAARALLEIPGVGPELRTELPETPDLTVGAASQ